MAVVGGTAVGCGALGLGADDPVHPHSRVANASSHLTSRMANSYPSALSTKRRPLVWGDGCMGKVCVLMNPSGGSAVRNWADVIARSLLVGAATGILGGALIFFVFGFIGFSGASFATRVENGWDAAIEPGLRRGLAAGLLIALGLGVTVVLLAVFGRRIDIVRARSWLTALSALLVVVYNAESLRNSLGWDVAGLATVTGISLVVGGIVWVMSPWVLGEGRREVEPGEG